jgi:hypothetical protein
MSAGLNRRCDIYHYSFLADDIVGGSQPTGTVSYWNVPLRMQENAPSQLLLQQGLETQRTFSGVIVPGTLKIYERDEIKITQPTDDVFYGDFFRIVGMRYSDFNPRDARNYIMLSLVRSDIAHRNDSQ